MPLSYKQLLKIALSYGYTEVSQKWSHVKFRKWENSIVVPKHKELKKWTAISILKDIALQNTTTLEEIKKEWGVKI